jgi:plasmid maintenance system antidote protein VapI
MKFEKQISPELRNILKACTTVQQRQDVASQNGMSLHTFNAMINGQRSITDSTKQGLIDLVSLSLDNANQFNLSLTEYYLKLI